MHCQTNQLCILENNSKGCLGVRFKRIPNAEKSNGVLANTLGRFGGVGSRWGNRTSRLQFSTVKNTRTGDLYFDLLLTLIS